MRKRSVFALGVAAVSTLAACSGSSGSLQLSDLPSSTSAPISVAGSPIQATTAPTGFPTTGAASRGGRAASPSGDFSVVVPPGWQENQSTAQSSGALDAYIGPTQGGFRTNVNVVREKVPAGVGVDQYRVQALTGLRRALAVSNITRPTTTRVDGEDARQYSFTDSQAGFRLRQQQTIVVHAGYGYVITYTATTAAFASSRRAAAAIVSSVRWA